MYTCISNQDPCMDVRIFFYQGKKRKKGNCSLKVYVGLHARIKRSNDTKASQFTTKDVHPNQIGTRASDNYVTQDQFEKQTTRPARNQPIEDTETNYYKTGQKQVSKNYTKLTCACIPRTKKFIPHLQLQTNSTPIPKLGTAKHQQQQMENSFIVRSCRSHD